MEVIHTTITTVMEIEQTIGNLVDLVEEEMVVTMLVVVGECQQFFTILTD